LGEPTEGEQLVASAREGAAVKLDGMPLVTEPAVSAAQLGEDGGRMGAGVDRAVVEPAGAKMEPHRSSARRQATRPQNTTPIAATVPCTRAMASTENGGDPSASPVA